MTSVESPHSVSNDNRGVRSATDKVPAEELTARSIRDTLEAFVSRVVASATLLITWPLLAMLIPPIKILFTDLRLERQRFVNTPAREHERLWQETASCRVVMGNAVNPQIDGRLSMWHDLLVRVLPGLGAVAAGRMRMLGTTPRPGDELQSVPEHWRNVLLTVPTGLISESLVQHGPNPPKDLGCISDVWYAVIHSRAKSCKLVGRYLKALIYGPLTNPAARAADVKRTGEGNNQGDTVCCSDLPHSPEHHVESI